ncbi:TPA: hypothetical protein DDW35_03355 [Candidatus Sumerlaeota bacterium]|jgi:CheY-like chemotaxis protein|nr:hypothetical protein [Candidatus Sumerlaeota bacterium]
MNAEDTSTRGVIMEQTMGGVTMEQTMDRNFISSFSACTWFKMPHQRERSGAMQTTPAEKYRILLVEDERPVREIARLMMQFAGHEVIIAADGAEALAIFERMGSDIDLVLLDYSLPGMDGIDVMGKLRAIRKDARIIMSSGYGRGDVLDRAQRKGANSFDAYLQKPFEMNELIFAVRDVMHTSPLA